MMLLAACTPATALAHALLLQAEPAVGATIPTAPARIMLRFSEGVEPAFSTIEVRDNTGLRVDGGAGVEFGSDGKTLILRLTPLGLGDYRVEWHATSVDTHKTQGHFGFSVGVNRR
jgi:methionine-rich copper-binding protein CopC